MIATLKAEYRKLFTIRSTYIVSLASVILLSAISFWFVGYKADPTTALNANVVSRELLSNVSFLAIFAAIVSILSITHEYRYNTIMYTLTASNSRSKVLLSKFVATTSFSILYIAIGLAAAVGAMLFGMHLADMNLIKQYLDWGDILWRLGVYAVGFAAMGLLFGFLFRNVVGAITSILLMPATVEQLLGLIFKENSVYLPFSALNGVITPATDPNALSHPKAAWVFGIYFVVGWIIAWILFVRRDAN